MNWSKPCWNQESLHDTNLNNALLQGEFHKITIHLHCLIVPSHGFHLMTPGWKHSLEIDFLNTFLVDDIPSKSW